MTETLVKLVFPIAYTYVVIYYFSSVVGKSLFPTGATLFVMWQSGAFLGTLLQINSVDEDVAILRLMHILLGMTMFVIGAAVANRAKNFKPRIAIPRFRQGSFYFDLHSGVYAWLIIGIGVVAVVISAVYAQNLGYSVLLASLREYISTGSLAYSMQIYSTGRRIVHGSDATYLATGYAMQFFATLLPLTVYLIYVRLKFLNELRDRILLLIFFPLTAYFLTLTGKRALVLTFSLTFFLLTTVRWGPFGEYMRGKIIPRLILGGAAAFYFLSTLLAGRQGVGYSIRESLLIPFADFFTRVVITTSRNQLAFLGIIDSQPFRWGRGWLSSLSIVLPGWSPTFSSGSQLSYLLRGDPGVSAPADFWTSTWWNFGWLGMVLVPLAVGYLFQRYSISFFNGKKTLSRVVVIYVSFFTLREITEPISFFNEGFVTLIIFYGLVLLVKHVESRLGPGREYDIEVNQVPDSSIDTSVGQKEMF